MVEYSNSKLVERFVNAKYIVPRLQTGKLIPSPAKQGIIDREFAFYLRFMIRGFKNMFEEDCLFNANETHFCVNLEDRHTLAMKCDTAVKNSDVGSGDVCMNMVVMVSVGKKPRFEIPMVISKNDRCSHPIQGVPDSPHRVFYRSGPTGWTDTHVFDEWFGEPLVIIPLTGGK